MTGKSQQRPRALGALCRDPQHEGGLAMEGRGQGTVEGMAALMAAIDET